MSRSTGRLHAGSASRGSVSGPGRNSPDRLNVARVMRIEIWSDVVCPWCYIGKRRLETALAGFDHRRRRSRSSTAPSSSTRAPRVTATSRRPGVLARKYGRSEAEMREMQQQLIEVAAEEGLAFRLFDNVAHQHHRRAPAAPPRPRRGRAGAAARAQGGAARGVLRRRAETSATTASSPTAATARRARRGAGQGGAGRRRVRRRRRGRHRPGPGVRRHRRAVLRRRREVRRVRRAARRRCSTRSSSVPGPTSRPALDMVGGGEACGPDGCAV